MLKLSNRRRDLLTFLSHHVVCLRRFFPPHPSQIIVNNNVVYYSFVVDIYVRIPYSEKQVYKLIGLRLTEGLTC